MYCVKCGKQINDGNSFCIYCGTPVKKTGTDKNAENASAKKEINRQNIKPRSEAKKDTSAAANRNSGSALQKKPSDPRKQQRANNRNSGKPIQAAANSQKPSSGNNKKKTGLLIAIILAVAAAVLAVFMAWYFLLRSPDDSDKKEKTRTESVEDSGEDSEKKSERSDEKSKENSSKEESSSESSSEDKSSAESSSAEESSSVSSSAASSSSETSVDSSGTSEDLPAEAAAEGIAEYRVSAASVSLFDDIETSAGEAVDKAKKGETLKILEYGCDGYWEVVYDNNYYYVIPTGLEYEEGEKPESSGTLFAVPEKDAESVPLYSEPEADDSNIIEYIPSDEEVDFYDITNNAFCLVDYDGKFGYVEEDYLKTSPAPSPTQTPTPTPEPTATAAPTAAPSASGQNGYGYFTVGYTSDYVTLRGSASLSGTSIVKVNLGERVFVYELAANGYYRVNYNGTDGYMLASYLIPESGSVTPGPGSTMTVQGDYLTLRYWPSNSTQEGDEIQRISGGAQVEFIEAAEYGFYFVRYNGRLGFVMSAYLK